MRASWLIVHFNDVGISRQNTASERARLSDGAPVSDVDWTRLRTLQGSLNSLLLAAQFHYAASVTWMLGSLTFSTSQLIQDELHQRSACLNVCRSVSQCSWRKQNNGNTSEQFAVRRNTILPTMYVRTNDVYAEFSIVVPFVLTK